MHSTYLFIDTNIRIIQTRNGDSVNFHMSNVTCNRKMLGKFVLSALIRKHINNIRTSIPIEKTEEINCKTLSRVWTVLKTISFHYMSITFTCRNQATTWPSYCLKLKHQKQCSTLFCFICNTTEHTHKNDNHTQIIYFKYSCLAWPHYVMVGWCGDVLEKFNIQLTLCQIEMCPKLIHHNHTRWLHYPYNILQQRLTPYVHKISVDHPHRFQHNRSTVSHILYLSNMVTYKIK